MKIIRDKVSDSYYNVYLILTNKEKKKYVDIVKRELKEITVKNLSERIAGELINYKKEKDPLRKKYILETINSLKNITPIGNEITDDVIETYLPSALMDFFIDDTINGNYAVCLNIEGSIIGSVSDDDGISVKFSFCFVSSDYNLKMPTVKGNPYFYTNKDTEMLINEILINCGFYSKKEILLVNDFSDILFTYIKKDDIAKDIYMDVNNLSEEYHINKSDIIGLAKGSYNLLDKDNQTVTVIIKEIYEKEVFKLTDEIVQELNIFEVNNVKDFISKVEEVYSRYLNINSNINSLTKRFLELNDFEIDDYVLKHYYRFKEIEEPIDNSYKYINDIKKSFLYGLLIDRCIDLDELGRSVAIDEYELFKHIKRKDSESTLMEYVLSRGPIIEIYYYLKKEHMITERR